MTGTCGRCDGPIDEKRLRRRAKFCSEACSKAYHRERYASANEALRVKIPPGTVGALAELVVAVDLMERGLEVFHAMSPSSSCDLAVLDGAVLRRVEVRTGHRTATGRLVFFRNPRDDGRHDLFAVVLHTEPREILYLDPALEPFIF